MSTQQPPVGLDVVADWIGEFAAVEGELTARRIGNGQSNLTYLLHDAKGRRWVLRRPPMGKLLQSAHDVGREYKIMSALQDTEVPVPRVFGLWHVDDVPHMLMEFVDGFVVSTPESVETLDPQVRHGIGPSIARTLGTIHDVDIDEVGLNDLASHAPYAQRQLKRWTKQLEASRTQDLPRLDELTQLLHDCVPEQKELRLVHGDLHINNVMIDARSGDVVAALDWELSTLGDPLSDLGSLLAYWPEPHEAYGADLFRVSTLPGFATRQEIIDAYAQSTGRDVSDVGFWHVLGLWKLVGIVEGIIKRVQDNPGNAALSGVPPQEYSVHLLDRAWSMVEHYRL